MWPSLLWTDASLCKIDVTIGWFHNDVIKWKHFPRYWSFVWGIRQSPANSPHKGQWRGTLIFSLICAWINGWVKNRDAVDLRRYRAHYDVIVMLMPKRVDQQYGCRWHFYVLRITLILLVKLEELHIVSVHKPLIHQNQPVALYLHRIQHCML